MPLVDIADDETAKNVFHGNITTSTEQVVL